MKTRISTAVLAAAVAAAMLLIGSANAFGYNVRLSQIDSSRLLFTQNVRLYVSVTDEEGNPVEGLEAEAFRI